MRRAYKTSGNIILVLFRQSMKRCTRRLVYFESAKILQFSRIKYKSYILVVLYLAQYDSFPVKPAIDGFIFWKNKLNIKTANTAK